MSSSCSFRITRTAEDLVQTLSTLSQRLVKLEQRQDALESALNKVQGDTSDEDFEKLDGIDEVLKECKQILENSTGEEVCSYRDDQDRSIAA